MPRPHLRAACSSLRRLHRSWHRYRPPTVIHISAQTVAPLRVAMLTVILSPTYKIHALRQRGTVLSMCVLVAVPVEDTSRGRTGLVPHAVSRHVPTAHRRVSVVVAGMIPVFAAVASVNSVSRRTITTRLHSNASSSRVPGASIVQCVNGLGHPVAGVRHRSCSNASMRTRGAHAPQANRAFPLRPAEIRAVVPEVPAVRATQMCAARSRMLRWRNATMAIVSTSTVVIMIAGSTVLRTLSVPKVHAWKGSALTRV